jgi:hypothetical protein
MAAPHRRTPQNREGRLSRLRAILAARIYCRYSARIELPLVMVMKLGRRLFITNNLTFSIA